MAREEYRSIVPVTERIVVPAARSGAPWDRIIIAESTLNTNISSRKKKRLLRYDKDVRPPVAYTERNSVLGERRRGSVKALNPSPLPPRGDSEQAYITHAFQTLAAAVAGSRSMCATTNESDRVGI